MNDIIKTLLSHPRDKPLSDGLLAGVLQALLETSEQTPSKRTSKASIALSMMDDDQLIGTKELALVIDKCQSTVEKMRRETGKGPPFIPGGKAKYRVGDVREWIAKNTVANTTEATVKGLSHYILEDATAFPVFRYADGSLLGLDAAIQYEQDHPETFCESFAVVNMGDAWAQHKDLYDALLSNPENAKPILAQPSVAKSFDVAYWLFVQFIGGKLDNFQPFLKAIRLLVEHGTDINAQNNMTGYNLAHVLAINEESFINENDFYNFMNELLDMGMDVDVMNHESISGRDIAEQNDTSPSSSNFLEVLNRRDFAMNLESKLSPKK
ncbi:helix-turn-helix domain-containing protein [Variovorax sp. RB3P1]|uniref:helix-turn-helix domain-containing protein n=1 Tax=Variovorax sp. RB3P1 TaxID=3443732 RepID=UPI003F4610BA